jgi:Protein of unknown function (DUF664)
VRRDIPGKVLLVRNGGQIEATCSTSSPRNPGSLLACTPCSSSDTVPSTAMPDRRTPFTLTDEKETLVCFLDYLRDAVVIKARGLDADVIRSPLVTSGTSLLGLIKHLAWVELFWFECTFLGLDTRLPTSELQPNDDGNSVVAAYRSACQRSNSIIGAEIDLDKRCARAGVAPEPMTLRWVLVHMVEETARHAGHADILREQIDGLTGR